MNEKDIINLYKAGDSMTSIAKRAGTFANTIRRILQKNNVPLRGDRRTRGSLCVKNGEELIAWAKAQGRLVTKDELANIVGTKKLSPSYFEKYPELGQYITTRNQNELQEYYDALYEWLRKNNISYKPNDKTKIKTSVDALLLGDYSNIILQIAVKPTHISNKNHTERMTAKKHAAEVAGVPIVFLHKEDFLHLDSLKTVLDSIK